MEGIKTVAELMTIAARTAPKTKGEDYIVVEVLTGESLKRLGERIALGSAVKVAGMMNVDNRIMYRAGFMARQLELIDADFVMGIPLSVTGKSIFFDR
jgi:uncharacterized ferredoxin-like protein